LPGACKDRLLFETDDGNDHPHVACTARAASAAAGETSGGLVVGQSVAGQSRPAGLSISLKLINGTITGRGRRWVADSFTVWAGQVHWLSSGNFDYDLTAWRLARHVFLVAALPVSAAGRLCAPS